MVATSSPLALYATTPHRRKVKLRAVPECTGTGVTKECTGSGYIPEVPQGCPLPALVGVQWEGKKDRPGWYCWHTPDGPQAHRNTKIYLGYANKKLLAEWLALSKAERLATVAAWVDARRREKGID